MDDQHSRLQRLGRMAAFGLIALAVGCASVRSDRSSAQLTRAQALQLAVTLANAKCEAEFSRAPFDSTRYAVELVDGTWRWGALHLASADGFSAEVTFDLNGKNPHAQVAFSSDALTPLYAPDTPNAP